MTYIETFSDEKIHIDGSKSLFYPASGSDTVAHIIAFWGSVSRYVFNDLNFSARSDREFASKLDLIREHHSDFNVVSRALSAPELRDRPIQRRGRSRGARRDLEPSLSCFEIAFGGTQASVELRRGFGQYAPAEQEDRSIGVFVHRRDSSSESGSNVVFLGNVRKRHPPLSNLWDKLSDKLADKAYIISDGSLCNIPQLCQRPADEGGLEPFKYGDFAWAHIGRMTDGRGGRIWRVERRTLTCV